MKKTKTEWIIHIFKRDGICCLVSSSSTKRGAIAFAENDVSQYATGSRTYKIIKRVETIVKETK